MVTYYFVWHDNVELLHINIGLILDIDTFFVVARQVGLVAQWIRHLTTNQGIAGSSPAKIKLFPQN